MKKIALIFAIILVVLIIGIIGLREKYYKTERDIFELSQNINNYKNIYVHKITTFDDLSCIEEDLYWKDYEYKEISYDNKIVKAYAYMNYEEKEFISISDEEKTIYHIENDEMNIDRIVNKANCFTGLLLSFENSQIQKYKFRGIEKINGKKCYKIILSNLLQEDDKATIWIDIETGFVLKYEQDFNKKITIYEYYYEIEKVTEQDLEKPNIEKLKNVEKYEYINKKYIGDGQYEEIIIDNEGNKKSIITH